MTNALALVPLDDMSRMADSISKSGLFGMKTHDQALALMLVAQAEGLHPATIAQDYDLIQGKATRKTHSVLARFQAAGGTVKWHELTDKKADATFTHPAGGSLRLDWTYEQAQKAKLTGKDNWISYARAMLRARCIAEGVRAVYPAALGGLMVSEEAMDVAMTRDMGPVEEVNQDTQQPATPAITPTASAALQPYPQERFDANLPEWTTVIQSGRHTADRMIAMLLTKGVLSDAQKKTLRDLEIFDNESGDNQGEQQ